ncbi:zinc ribbon domain-containing protein [Salinicoccus siamensis]|uniref:Zinc ribbon domain-containing protein n=2 Tax=Salinicoccus TaxID=45669 RepID=A0ABV5Z5A7_9STAP
MPRYTFECRTCGSYETWKRSTEDLAGDQCPECGSESKRVFQVFRTSYLDAKVTRHIEQGMTPKVVKKTELPQRNKRQGERNPRPWMM